MQCGRAGFLRAGQNEIEPLNLPRLSSPHRHESRTSNQVAQSASLKQKARSTANVDLFCNRKTRRTVFTTAMSFALKACVRGILTLVHFIIVVAFVVSLGAIAALGCLGARKRARASKTANVLLDQFGGHHPA